MIYCPHCKGDKLYFKEIKIHTIINPYSVIPVDRRDMCELTVSANCLKCSCVFEATFLTAAMLVEDIERNLKSE